MKTLTAEHADRLLRRCLFPQNSPWFPVDDELDDRLRPIASGAHEVHDRATHRAVTVETIRTIEELLRLGYAPTDALRKARAEIEEKLR